MEKMLEDMKNEKVEVKVDGLGYFFTKLQKIEKIVRFYNSMDEDEIISIHIFKHDVVVRTYKKEGQILKSLIIKK